ncbi:MAG TPA: BT4734/BF3469 family protein [Prolixibacteraceae bacterium]|jgi:hypothetical protein
MNQTTPEQGHPTNPESLVAPASFSFFRRPITNTVPYKGISLLQAYLDIQSDRNQWQTDLLRTLSDKNQAKIFKARYFDYVTFSGTFTRRSDASLILHSGLLTIDLDHVDDLPQVKNALLNDRFFETELLFISPSGNGLKWIVAIDTGLHSHLHWFKSIANYIDISYRLEVDASGKDLSRACFLPCDPEVYIHPKYLGLTIND